jgi:mRNA interferase HigB
MNIVHMKNLHDFAKNHANARKSLIVWKLIVKQAKWKNKKDILKDFPRAKMINANRARFEIVHNVFRLIAHVDYEDKIVEIRFIGTHNEYDRIDPATI